MTKKANASWLTSNGYQFIMEHTRISFMGSYKHQCCGRTSLVSSLVREVRHFHLNEVDNAFFLEQIPSPTFSVVHRRHFGETQLSHQDVDNARPRPHDDALPRQLKMLWSCNFNNFTTENNATGVQRDLY